MKTTKVGRRPRTVELALLGPLELRVEGRRRPTPPPSARRLLIYLALEGGIVSRDNLISLLWPGIATDRSRPRLSQALHQLKICLGRQGGPTLLVETNSLGLDPAALSIDAFLFQSLAGSARPQDHSEALALLRGNPYEHSDQSNPRWSAWYNRHIQILQSLAADLFARAVEESRSQGRLSETQDLARRWVAFAPESDLAHLALMRTLVEAGLENAALAHCDLFVKRLAEEHGHRPGKAIQDFRKRLRNKEQGVLSPQSDLTASYSFHNGAVTVLACYLQKTNESPESLVVRYYPLLIETARLFEGTPLLNPNSSMEIRFHDREDGVRRAGEAALRVRAHLENGIMAGYGIHCGTVLITNGPHPHILGDISRYAHDLALHGQGQIVVSEVARTRAPTSFHYTLTPELLTGSPTFFLLGVSSTPRPKPLRTFGRENELRSLQSAWTRASKTGQGAVVHIFGEPGIGKTHLLRQFCQDLPCHTHVREYRCVPEHQRSVLGSIEAVVRDILGGQDNQAFDYEALSTALTQRGIADEWLTRLWAAWLGISAGALGMTEEPTPSDYRDVLHESILDVLSYGLKEVPRIVIVDDLQWIDPSSLQVLSLFVKRVERSSCLVIFASRERGLLQLATARSVIDIAMTPLTPAATEQLILDVAPSSTKAIQKAIAARSEGTPLFTKTIAELVHSVADAQTLLPNSLHETLTARIYALGQAALVAQTASILGQSFQLSHLADLQGPMKDHLPQALGVLKDAGIFGFADETHMRFSHALYFDATIATIPAEQKRAWHGKAALLLSQDLGWSAAHPERVAEHFCQGGNLLEAVKYWRIAARRAATLLTPKSALLYLTSALTAIDGTPDSNQFWREELALRCDYLAMCWGVEGFASQPVRENLSRLLALCERHSVKGPPYYLALRGVWLGAFGYGDMREAERAGDALWAAASECEDPEFGVVAGRFAQGVSLLWQGKILDAADALEDGIRQCQPSFHAMSRRLLGEDVAISLRAYRAIANLIQGRLQDSQTEIDALWQETEDSGVLPNIAYVLVIHAALSFFQRDLERAPTVVARLEEVCHEASLGLWDAVGGVYRAWVNAELGLWTTTNAFELESTMGRIEELWRSGLSFCSTIQCAALLAVGEPTFPKAVANARALIEKTGADLMLPDLLLQEGLWNIHQEGRNAVAHGRTLMTFSKTLATRQGNRLVADRAQKALGC